MRRELFVNREILRYMGLPEKAQDDATQREIEKCIADLKRLPEPKYVYRYDEIQRTDTELRLPRLGLSLKGKDIRRHLEGCSFCGVLAATLGVGMDEYLRRMQVVSMSRALAADACGTAAIEAVCDEAEQAMVAENPGLYTTFRFSPGYGDLPIDTQKELLRAVDAGRRIGLGCTGTSLLTPTKSVTAILGFSTHPIERGRRGCAACSLRETCIFRKKGDSCGA